MPDTKVTLNILDQKHPCIVFDSASGPPALSIKIMDRLMDLIKQVRELQSIRTLTITGKKSVFLAGGDLRDFLSLDTPEKGRKMAVKMRGVIDALQALPVPVVAAINGNAFGGGMELAVACDLRFAIEDAKMGFTQARFGLIPGWGGATRLAALTGPGRAFYLLSSARLIDAHSAMSMGLVDAVAGRHDFEALLKGYRHAVEDLSPGAIAAMKRVILSSLSMWSANLDYELKEFTGLWAGKEHQKGLDAFFAKEKPKWEDK